MAPTEGGVTVRNLVKLHYGNIRTIHSTPNKIYHFLYGQTLCGGNDVRTCGKKFLRCLEVPSVPPTPPCAADCGLRSIWHGCMAQGVL